MEHERLPGTGPSPTTVAPPANIVCVDCGGTCHLLSHRPPDDPWEPGDVVAYRCSDCADRWDIVLEADDF